MVLRVLFCNLMRMIAELGRLVAVNILLVFSRSSVNTGNDILIPGFYMKLDLCFFLLEFLGTFLLSIWF